MTQPVNPADIHNTILAQQKAEDRKKLAINTVFIAILLVALAYAWRKGALEWS